MGSKTQLSDLSVVAPSCSGAASFTAALMMQVDLPCNDHLQILFMYRRLTHISIMLQHSVSGWCCCCLPALTFSKLFQDDPAVKSGLLQVFVRMKPVPETTETCMQLEQSQLLKAIWYVKYIMCELHSCDLSTATAAVMAAATNTHAFAGQFGCRERPTPCSSCAKQCSTA